MSCERLGAVLRAGTISRVPARSQDTRTFEGTEWGTTFNGQMLQGQHLDLLFFPGGEVAVREAGGRLTQSFMEGTQKRSPAASSAKLAVGDYYLEDIVIAVRRPKLGVATSGQPPEGYDRLGEHRIATGGSSGWGGPGSPRFYSHAELAQCPKFVIEPNKLNEWRIAIPEELLQSAREKLDQPKPEPEGPQEAEPET